MYNKIIVIPTCSIWDLPIMTEGICPSMPGSLLCPSNHVPGMAICDSTGLLGTPVDWPSCRSDEWFSVSAAMWDPGLPSCDASAAGLLPPDPCSSSSITHSWESPSWGTGLKFTATKPLLAAASSGSGVAVPERSSLQEDICCSGPFSGIDFSPTWERTGRCLPRLKWHIVSIKVRMCLLKGWSFCLIAIFNYWLGLKESLNGGLGFWSEPLFKSQALAVSHPPEQRCSPFQKHCLWTHPSRWALHGAGVWTLVSLVLTVFILTHNLGKKKKEEEGVSETVARHFKKRGRQPKLFLLYQFVRKTVSNFNQSLAEEDVGAEVRESFSHWKINVFLNHIYGKHSVMMCDDWGAWAASVVLQNDPPDSTKEQHYCMSITSRAKSIILYIKVHSTDLPDHWLSVFMVFVTVHLFPYVCTRGGRRGYRGAVVSVTEALPLQDILSVLPLQLAWQHWSIGHAVEETGRSPCNSFP